MYLRPWLTALADSFRTPRRSRYARRRAARWSPAASPLAVCIGAVDVLEDRTLLAGGSLLLEFDSQGDVQLAEQPTSTDSTDTFAIDLPGMHLADPFVIETFDGYANGIDFPPNGSVWGLVSPLPDGVSLTVTDNAFFGSSGKSLHFADESGSGGVHIRRSFTATTDVSTEYYMRSDNAAYEGPFVNLIGDGGSDYRVAFGNGSGGSAEWLGIFSDEGWTEPQFLPYEAGKWYHVVRTLNTTTKTGTFYVAEVDDATGLDIPSKSNTLNIGSYADNNYVDQVEIFTSGGQLADAYVDNLLITDVNDDEQIERWVHYVPGGADINVVVDERVSVGVSMTFASSGYRVSDWGEVTRNGNSFMVDSLVERWTGISLTVITYRSHSYDVGTLDQGDYTFEFWASGQIVDSVQFAVGEIDFNNAPVLGPIPDQTILHTQDTLTIPLPTTDADGNTLSYTAEVISLAQRTFSLAKLAYDVDQQLDLYKNGDYGQNWGGRQERWMQSDSQTPYFITADGTLYVWGGSMEESEKEATFDRSYYDDPRKLHEASVPVVIPAVGITATISDNELIIDPADGFFGTLPVTVTASDGVHTTSDTFYVNVVNTAPTLQVCDQTIHRTQDTLTISLPATDRDGDTLTYTAEVISLAELAFSLAQQAYQLNEELGLFKNGDYGTDWAGLDEKWMQSASGIPYFITPDGTLYRWGGNIEQSVVIDSFNASYHADPTKLHEAHPPVTIPEEQFTFTVSENELIIELLWGGGDTLQVTVTVSDGVHTVPSSTFNVYVVNTAPTLQFCDQTMHHTQDTLTISLPTADTEGDTAKVVSPVQQAYDLDQDLGLYKNGDYGQNWGGRQERWMQSASGIPYFITPDGTLYRWEGSVDESMQVPVAKFDPSYHADPTKLHEAPEPDVDVEHTATISGNRLIIDPAAGFLGALQVTYFDSDQAQTHMFNVNVVNTAPTLEIADQTIHNNGGAMVISLPTTDTDGDTLSYTVQIATGDPSTTRAYQLDQQSGLFKNGDYGTDWAGLGEKWMQSASDIPYFITPEGTLYRWEGGVDESMQVPVAKFDPSYHADPTKLHEAVEPELGGVIQGSTATLDGNLLTITPGEGYTGTIRVTVTASDGAQSGKETFYVNVGIV